MSEITQCFPFSIWLISLSVIPSRSIHVVANAKILSFKKIIYLFIWLCLVLVATSRFFVTSCRIFCCGLQTLVVVYGLTATATATAKSLQSCPTLCDPKDGSPPCSSIPGILQARTLEWVAISFSNAWKWKVKVKSLSRVRLVATPWLQPTRLLHPWDFPGKSTGVGCQCLLRLVTAYGCSYSVACGILVPILGTEPASSALQGEFLTTGPQGSPYFF